MKGSRGNGERRLRRLPLSCTKLRVCCDTKVQLLLGKWESNKHPADIRFLHCVPNSGTSADLFNDHFPLNGNGSATIKLTNARS